jgi:hypothetical protein
MTDEELIARLRELDGWVMLGAHTHLAAADRIEALTEKLAKAVAALGRAKASIENGGGGGVTDVVWLDDPCPETLCDFIDATLAEIEGEKG